MSPSSPRHLPLRGDKATAALVLGTAGSAAEGPGLLLSMATSVTGEVGGGKSGWEGAFWGASHPRPRFRAPFFLTLHVRLHLLALGERGGSRALHFGLDDEGALAAAQVHFVLRGEEGMK